MRNGNTRSQTIMAKKLTKNEFQNLPVFKKIEYAMKVKMSYYDYYDKRPLLRGFSYLGKKEWCPNCKKEVELVSIGFLNIVVYNRLISYQRCPDCCIKLPIIDKKIQKMLGLLPLRKKHVLPPQQMILK